MCEDVFIENVTLSLFLLAIHGETLSSMFEYFCLLSANARALYSPFIFYVYPSSGIF